MRTIGRVHGDHNDQAASDAEGGCAADAGHPFEYLRHHGETILHIDTSGGRENFEGFKEPNRSDEDRYSGSSLPCSPVERTVHCGPPRCGESTGVVHRKSKLSRILVAEDVDSNFHLLQVLLGRRYEMRRALNGAEAVAIFEEQQYKPDLILMDMKMPVMNGLEATREIRKLSSEIPIIALTANAFGQDREEAIEAGCNDFLTKPISAELLNATIGKYDIT